MLRASLASARRPGRALRLGLGALGLLLMLGLGLVQREHWQPMAAQLSAAELSIERLRQLFDAEPRSVTVASVPSGARVLLAGAELGVTPYRLQLKRPTELHLELAGYANGSVRVEPDGEPNLVVKLAPLPPLRAPDDAMH